MDEKKPYSINKDIQYGGLELIDVSQMVEACELEWFNQSLCRVNDCVVRLGIIHGEFHWHKHDEEDEFFYVVDGRLLIDLEEGSFELGPKRCFTVPRGVLHRTRAPEKTVMLMVEGAGVEPAGD